MKGGRHVHVHVVQKGDTLWKISRQYGVSFDEVKRLNAHLANPDYVVPGMKIFVPEQAMKKQEVNEHPFQNNRPVKNLKEEVAPPTKKAMTQPIAQPTPPPVPKQMPQPMPMPMPQQMPQQMPQPMPQPQPQVHPIPYPYPISQDISMTNIMPSIMSMPYGWMPVPDVDATHIPQPIHQKPTPPPMPAPPTPKPAPKLPQVSPTESMPMSKPYPTPAKPSKLPGWKLQDSSSIDSDMSSSLEMPVLPQYTQAQQEPAYKPCGCGGHSQYDPYSNAYSPTGNMGHYQSPYPTQTLGAGDPYMQMPQNHYNMMAPQMSPQMPPQMSPQMLPYMACTPCHGWQVPQGQWGYQAPVRYN